MRRISECEELPGPGPALGTFWKDNTGHLYQVEYVSQTEWFIEITHLQDGETYNEKANMFENLYEPILDADELG